MGKIEEKALLLYGYVELIFGLVLLLGLIYTYYRVYRLKNLSFITKLLLMIMFISLTEIYSGILFIGFMDGADWAKQGAFLVFLNTTVNIIYEINTILITWIVGF